MFLILEILLDVTVSVIHYVHDYQSCITIPSKPTRENTSRNVITSQNAY